MKQVLAVGVAALLVALAIVVRGALDDDGDGTGSDDDGPTAGLVVACVRELAAACQALDADVRVEDPAATIATASDVDAWVTLDPWPDIGAASEQREVIGGDRVAVASSDLVLVIRTALDDECADWACAAELRPALPRPATALGRLLLGHAALGWSAVERPGEPFARNDFGLPEFDRWFDALDFERDPVLDMLQLGAAGPGATGTTGATFDTVVRTSPRSVDIEAFDTGVPASVVVTVVGPAARRIAGNRDLLDGLAELGWDLDVEADATTTGLPSAGVLFALQELS